MIFENKIHSPYEHPQQINVVGGGKCMIYRSRLIQRDFSIFLIQLETDLSTHCRELKGKECLCYLGDRVFKAIIGNRRTHSSWDSSDGKILRLSFECKKLVDTQTENNNISSSHVDYIIPYSKIDLFDDFSICLNKSLIRDTIYIKGRAAVWTLKNLISLKNGKFSISPFIYSTEYALSDHLILSTEQDYSAEVEQEANDISSLLQLALGNLAQTACRLTRRHEQIMEYVVLHAPNKIPRFWSPLSPSQGLIKRFIESAILHISNEDGSKNITWKAILATYATLNMKHVHLEHRLLFSYLLLDSLYNKLVYKSESHMKQEVRTLPFDASSLEKDLVQLFRNHGITTAENKAKKVLDALSKQGKNQGKVQSFEQRVRQLFSKYNCPHPLIEDLQQRNEIMHEGSLNKQSTDEKLKLMTRIFNAVTRLLFNILQYKGYIRIFPENEWQVIN